MAISKEFRSPLNVRYCNHCEGCPFARIGLPVGLQGCQLYRLMMEDLATTLHRPGRSEVGRREQPSLRRVQGTAEENDLPFLEEKIGTYSSNHESRRLKSSHGHVTHTNSDRGIKDGPHEVRHHKSTIDEFVSGWGMHPGICSQNPESREDGPKCHETRGYEMDDSTYPFPAEEHDAQKPSLQEKSGHHLKGQEGGEDVAHCLGEKREVCTELKLQHDSRDHSHSEIDCKDLRPETVHAVVDLLLGL